MISKCANRPSSGSRNFFFHYFLTLCWNFLMDAFTLHTTVKARGLRIYFTGLLWYIASILSGKAQGRNKNFGGTADQVILKQVKHASKTTDGNSERVASDFLERRLPPQEFLEEFLRERQRYHMLAAKIECMKRDIHF